MAMRRPLVARIAMKTNWAMSGSTLGCCGREERVAAKVKRDIKLVVARTPPMMRIE
jgi:hypothetical protein